MDFTNKIQKIRGKSGIYALIQDNKIVYVGSSSDAYTRILEHKADNKKIFNRITFAEFDYMDDGEARKIIEMGVICYMKPLYNKIVFDNFVFWLYSLPHERVKDSTVKKINEIVKNTVLSLSKGGRYEY